MGDGAIIEFDSVVDAMACAVALQKGGGRAAGRRAPERRIVFRIGINLGDVVVEGRDLLGDGVNIAARLEQLCEPGGVLISGTVYDHCKASSTVASTVWASSASRTSRAPSGCTRCPPRLRLRSRRPRMIGLPLPFCRSTTWGGSRAGLFQ